MDESDDLTHLLKDNNLKKRYSAEDIEGLNSDHALFENPEENKSSTSEPNEENIEENAINEERNSCCSKTCDLFKLVTVEPLFFMFLFAWSMQGLIGTNMLLDKTCSIHFNFSSTICSNLTSFDNEQKLVQQYANRLSMYCDFIQNFPNILFVLFLGSWSDKHGRKIPLTLPFAGSLLSSAGLWVNAYFWLLPPEYILLTAIPRAFTGGFTCLLMVMYAYISDISDIKSRTARIGIIDFSFCLGPSLGLLLSNYIFVITDYSGTFIICGLAFFVCILYITFLIKETRGPGAVLDLERELIPSARGKLKELFDCNNLRQTVRTTFKKRSHHKRMKMVILMVAMCLMVFVFNALTNEYLYVKLKFAWNYSQYVYLFVASITMKSIGVGILLPLLSYKLGVKDFPLALVGCISCVAGAMTQAFASQGYQMYIGACIAILGGIPLAVNRSVISKIASKEDSGKVFSVLASWEAFIPLIASPIFTLTYNKTMNSFPGTFYLIEAGLYATAGILFTVVFCLNRQINIGPMLSAHDQ